MYPGDLYYSESHQWARVDEGVATVGITNYAQEQLGDIVYVDLPRPDEEARRGEPLGSVESVKAVADVSSPVTGRVIEVNTALDDAPEQINQSPYDEGWLAKIELSDPAEIRSLMNAQRYVQFLQQLTGNQSG
ncbi:MAG TPA: glycine cleavage system protein GcvH [Armatimonadota bacterium]|nr:glycine cleavage system protein GcvH [Armatimonadota bacterium]